jgi:hypothetical protein
MDVSQVKGMDVHLGDGGGNRRLWRTGLRGGSSEPSRYSGGEEEVEPL